MYAILRVEKCKTTSAIASRAAHNLRANESAAPHADPAKRLDNKHLAGGRDFAEVMAAVGVRLLSAGKFRVDAVLAVELMLSASPNFFNIRKSDEHLQAWQNSTMEWVNDTFCADNIVSAEMHLDETTAHIQVLLVPLHNGKLCAAHWLDGPAKLRKLQDSYASAVEKYGLRRGERGSNAKHVELSKFYTLAHNSLLSVKQTKANHKPPSLPARGFLGKVRSDDWKKFAGELERYSKVGQRLRYLTAARDIFVNSEVGKENSRRLESKLKLIKEADARLAEIVDKVKIAETFLAQQRNEFSKNEILASRFDRKLQEQRDFLRIEELEAQRDKLVLEISLLEQRRDGQRI
jgi:hypothetical protein